MPQGAAAPSRDVLHVKGGGLLRIGIWVSGGTETAKAGSGHGSETWAGGSS